MHGPEELADALDLAYRHDEKALVEEFMPGREIECGVLGNERAVASAVGEILPHAEWYDYAAKYDEGGSDIVVPADLPAAVAERVRAIALDAFRALELSGMARVDFFLTPAGEVLVNEVNTIPGFTSDLRLRAPLRRRRRELSRRCSIAWSRAGSSDTPGARATATEPRPQLGLGDAGGEPGVGRRELRDPDQVQPARAAPSAGCPSAPCARRRASLTGVQPSRSAGGLRAGAV